MKSSWSKALGSRLSPRPEAGGAGFYDSPWGKRFPRLQILTVSELLDGKSIEYPQPSQVNVTYRFLKDSCGW
jgi:hypothetical protein